MHHESNFFAFIGIGSHSQQNLYPCLNYLGIPLKYVYSRNAKVAELLAKRFPNCQSCNVLDIIFQDISVKGVFICTKPELHFKYAMAALKAGKYVFLEKPPCFTIKELKQLEDVGGDRCFIAFQKRYSKINQHLLKLKGAMSYNYRYCTGPYPEGNAQYELFSHAVDNIIFLFGAIKKINIITHNHGKEISYAINTLHQNDIIGNLELSTAYSWSNFIDEISINYTDKTVYAKYPGELTIQKKRGSILSLPIEKLFDFGIESTQLLKSNNNTPVLKYNPIYLNGYYDAIRQFIKLVNGNPKANKSTPAILAETWRILGSIA